MAQKKAERESLRSRVTATGLTDRGKAREDNEDAFSVDEALGLFLVSDGMGGAEAGERASAAATQVLPLQIKAALNAGGALDESQIEEVLG